MTAEARFELTRAPHTAREEMMRGNAEAVEAAEEAEMDAEVEEAMDGLDGEGEMGGDGAIEARRAVWKAKVASFLEDGTAAAAALAEEPTVVDANQRRAKARQAEGIVIEPGVSLTSHAPAEEGKMTPRMRLYRLSQQSVSGEAGKEAEQEDAAEMGGVAEVRPLDSH
jgi:hypothetical protein